MMLSILDEQNDQDDIIHNVGALTSDSQEMGLKNDNEANFDNLPDFLKLVSGFLRN